jgi:hypothetical protein
LNVTVTLMLFVKFLTTHTGPDTVSQPAQPPNVDRPVGAAVIVTVVPSAKVAVHVVAQPSPIGELEIVPVPVPAKSAVTVGPPPVKQTTLAVI